MIDSAFQSSKTLYRSLVASESTDKIPVPHRLAIIYLMLPVVIWLVGWFEWWIGIPAGVLVVAAMWRPLAGSWRVSVSPENAVIALLALAWALLAVTGGVDAHHSAEWDKHRALFLDLSRGDWPTHFATYFDAPVLLRYYLGYYMLPGMIATWFGPATLNWIVPFYTWLGVVLLLVMFARTLFGWKAIVAAALLIVFTTLELSVDVMRVEWGRTMFTSLMLFPQHFLPGMLYPLLLLTLRRNGRFLAICGLVLASSLFWSPIVAIGLLPLVLVLLVENGYRPFLKWQNTLIALPLLLLIVAYLSFGSTAIPHGWVWEGADWESVVAAPEFTNLLTLLLYAALVVLIQPALRRDLFFIACCASIILLPWYSFGLLNEYPRYTAFVPLLLLCFYCTRSVLVDWSPLRLRWQKASLLMLVLVLVIGLGNPLMTILQVNLENISLDNRYENLGSDFTSVLEVTEPRYHDQYATLKVPDWYDLLLRKPGAVTLERGELIIESYYDVFLSGRQLIYVRDPCTEAETDTRFILFIHPVDKSLIAGQEHDSKDFFFARHGTRIGGVCIATRILPEYEIDFLITGQYEGTYAPTGDRWTATYHVK